MQMSRQKKSGLILLLFAVVSLAVMAADTENQPTNSAQSEAVPETSSQSPSQTDDESEEQLNVKKAPPVTGAAVKPLKEFKPTEQIEADSAVSFPVDI